MKKLINLTIAVAFLSVTVISCKKEQVLPNSAEHVRSYTQPAADPKSNDAAQILSVKSVTKAAPANH